MKRTSLLVLALSATTLAACDGLNEALTAHVDIVAKAGSQELSVIRLGDLLGNAKMQIPVNHEVALLIARDLWVPYQLLALAAARGDSMKDAKMIDSAASAMLETARLSKFMESVAAKFPADAGSEADYNGAKGDLYSARHILFGVPQGSSPQKKDSVRKKAASVLATLNTANFAEMANKHSEDPGNLQRKNGGELGVFPAAQMVKPFGDALRLLKPGQISPLVETQFGFHIIQRNTWDKAKTDYAATSSGRGRFVAESTYIAQVQASNKVDLKADAATTMKELAKDPISHRHDKNVVATFPGGSVTAGKLALVLLANPSSRQVIQQILSAPDSLVNQYVTNMAQREVLLHRADSAKIAVSPEELANLHRDFAQAIVSSWQALGVDPKSLADSGKTPAERERIAAARIEAFLDRIMTGSIQPLPVPAPLQIALLDKFDAKVNAAGLDRAVERAQKLRAQADSAKAASQPKSAVPLPGAMPPAGAPMPSPTPPKPTKP